MNKRIGKTSQVAGTLEVPGDKSISHRALILGAMCKGDMAVANLIGSNLFNLTIVPIVDIIYTKGPILAEISESNIITAAVVLVMSVLFLAAFRVHVKQFLRLSWFNISLIILFLFSAYMNFIIG